MCTLHAHLQYIFWMILLRLKYNECLSADYGARPWWTRMVTTSRQDANIPILSFKMTYRKYCTCNAFTFAKIQFCTVQIAKICSSLPRGSGGTVVPAAPRSLLTATVRWMSRQPIDFLPHKTMGINIISDALHTRVTQKHGIAVAIKHHTTLQILYIVIIRHYIHICI
jgi:hypothetical protein